MSTTTASNAKTLTLDTPLRYIKGVGPERSGVLERLGLRTVRDLFYFFPRRYEARFPVKKISEVTREGKECVAGQITGRGLIRTKTGQTIFRLACRDLNAGDAFHGRYLFAVYFNQPYLKKVFLPGQVVRLYGQVEQSGRHLQMTHPEYEIIDTKTGARSIHTGRLVPIYPLTEDLYAKSFRQLIYAVLRAGASLWEDPLAESLRKAHHLIGLKDALINIHFPASEEARQTAYERLVFDEFLVLQLAVGLLRQKLEREDWELLHTRGENEVELFIETLGFHLTNAQKNTLFEIVQDMKRPTPMHRLVQGDVGSGKTVVAAAALLFTVSNGFQGALMAPTEVLAQQHFLNLSRMLEGAGVRCAYLGQGITEPEKKKLLDDLALGHIHLVIGTHALIQENVRFKRLGLVIVDEQHKFGVAQRSLLKKKAGAFNAHLLLLSATPIPRSLAMTLYGDLDISTIAELPKGRKPIKTLWVREEERSSIYDFIAKELEAGRQAYVVCPLIDGKALSTLKGAKSHHEILQKRFEKYSAALLHGRLKSDEKKKIMCAFKENKLQLLVSTVVIEVGIDTPNATVLIVENAERFGLAQLHQLRGRVGRGDAESYCFLFSATEDPDSVERLNAFEQTTSGFEIAEKDLAMRGAGDFAGIRQHGAAKLRIGDLSRDMGLLRQARDAAKEILRSDPELADPEHAPLRNLVQERFEESLAKDEVLAG